MRILVVAAILFFALAGFVFWLSKAQPPEAGLQGTPTPPAEETDASVPRERIANEAQRKGELRATIVTEKGDIVLALYPTVAPKTVENFAKLAREGFYDGIRFHRVVSGFVIQAGDPLSKDDDPANDGTGGPGYAFEDEINPAALGLSEEQVKTYEAQGYAYRDDLPSLSLEVGVVAMANSGPATNGSQFFIVTEKAQPHLNGKHTVFGEVLEGMDAVRAIAQGEIITTVRVSDDLAE